MIIQETIYQENKIKKLLYEMSSIFTDITLRKEVSFNSIDTSTDYDFEIETDKLKEDFQDLAKSVFKLCKAYFECKGLNNYLNTFTKDVEPFFTKQGDMFSEALHEESGYIYSEFTSLFWSYLQSFPAFENEDTLLRRVGINYLENILENTAVILKNNNVTPRKETDVYKEVKIFCKVTFPNATFPSESFQKNAKCYIPDILIPSLNCAVEYKYAESEARLVETIDEILIDVEGYADNAIYKIFYAVFYVKPGIWSKRKFEEVWSEKKFPKNWKGIMVIGE